MTSSIPTHQKTCWNFCTTACPRVLLSSVSVVLDEIHNFRLIRRLVLSKRDNQMLHQRSDAVPWVGLQIGQHWELLLVIQATTPCIGRQPRPMPDDLKCNQLCCETLYLNFETKQALKIFNIPVVPHKPVAEVSKIGKPLMDQKVLAVSSLSLSFCDYLPFFFYHLPSGLRTSRFSDPTFRPSVASDRSKKQSVSRLSYPFRTSTASFFWLFLFYIHSLFWSFSSLCLCPALLFICPCCRQMDFSNSFDNPMSTCNQNTRASQTMQLGQWLHHSSDHKQRTLSSNNCHAHRKCTTNDRASLGCLTDSKLSEHLDNPAVHPLSLFSRDLYTAAMSLGTATNPATGSGEQRLLHLLLQDVSVQPLQGGAWRHDLQQVFSAASSSWVVQKQSNIFVSFHLHQNKSHTRSCIKKANKLRERERDIDIYIYI